MSPPAIQPATLLFLNISNETTDRTARLRAGVEGVMEPSEEQANLKREFARFLEEQHGNVNYDKAIQELIARGDRRLPVDLNLLRSFDADLANG